MGEDLAKRMAREHLENLVAMAESRPEDGFELDVIEAARKERAARKIDYKILSEVRINQENLHNEEDVRSNIPLSNLSWLAIAAIGPVLILSIILALSFRVQGYRQKSKDAFGAIVAGFVIWAVGIPAIAFILDWLGIA